MKISYRILLINFAIVVLVLSSSAFAFYSIMYEVLTSRQSQYLLNSANNLVYALREIQQVWQDDIQFLKDQAKDKKFTDYSRFNPQNIDFILKESESNKLTSILANSNLLRVPSGTFSIEEFIAGNPLALITSYKDNSGTRYFFGKIISEEFLNMIAQRINAEVAVNANGIPEEISNKLNNQKHLAALLDAGRVLKNKENYKTYTASENSADFIASVYRAKELSISGNGLQFLVFHSITEVASLRSSIQDIIVIIGSAGVILSLILTFLFTDRLRKEIKQVSDATKISKDGRFINKIDLKSKDEFGQLASSFNEMIDELERHQRARNEYSEFLTLLNQNPSFLEISDAVLKKIIKSCGFTAGALYSVFNEEVSLTSTFGIKSGISVRENNDLFYTVAKSKEPLEFNFNSDLPVVSSGTYDISIKYLLVQPVVYNNKVIAILELAGLEPPVPEVKEYLSNIHDQLAIGLTNAGALVQLENLVSELKQLNEDYQKQNMHIRKQNETLTELHKKLKEKAEELEIQKEKAEESTKLKSQFLAGVSHELRTPMNSILGLTELIVNDSGIERKHRERLQVVLKNGNRLMSLINEILDLSKIEAGKMLLNPESFVVEEIISAAESAVSPLAARKKLKFIIERSCETNIIINSDREKITQVIINLLDNAIKFTENGSVTFRISTEDKIIKFKVTDTGIGMAKSDLEIIFNEFRQLDGSNARKYSGTGLGLAICKRLADILKGYISVESEPGKGSSFTFAVPVTNSAAENTFTPENITISSEETRKRILVIDHDPDIRYMIGQYLVSRNYEVHFAENQREALLKIKKIKPFAVTLNINFPGDGPWNLLSDIKVDPENAGLPVILLSINGEQNFGYGLGAYDYLIKPIDTGKLKSFLDDFEKLIKRRAQRILYIDNAEAPEFDLSDISPPVEMEIIKDPENAFEKILHFRPDIIIAGILMPELDGVSLIHILKTGKETKNIPVVLSIPPKFSDQERVSLNSIIDKLMINTKAHPLDLLKIIRDRIEIHEDQTKRLLRVSPDSDNQSEISLLTDDDYIGEVMIVDDDPDTLFTLNEVVKSCKCKTIIAKSGKECLQLLDYNSPGLILLDIMMPDMDGFQTLKQIKKKKKSQNIPVFAVTARAMAEDKEIILKYGFDDYISKPVNSGVMAFKIERLFSKIKIA